MRIILYTLSYFFLASYETALCQVANPTQTNQQWLYSLNAQRWPSIDNGLHTDVTIIEQAKNLLEKLTLEQKIGQLIAGDINSLSPEDLIEYPLGAVISGGNSSPDGSPYATAQEWSAFNQSIYNAVEQRGDAVIIPPLLGTDAVHGHNNVIGATLFPHNIGLGATNDPDLIRRIGISTGKTMLLTGHDWNFAPTLAVAQDLRWGRSYESFSSDPNIVRELGKAYIEGIQSVHNNHGHVLATAKHFVGDGGTTHGLDQGETIIPEQTLINVHGKGFYGALEANVATVMASYSSFNGRKIHGHDYLLNDILKKRLGFSGFVIGDWDAHAQLTGCGADHCSRAINAGVDMLMAPNQWRDLFQSLKSDVENGKISKERLDEAVTRILVAKYRAGILPYDPFVAKSFEIKDYNVLADESTRLLAREAVRKSIVMLKNEGSILPINSGIKTITVIGTAADDIATQCGGWCLSWQGTNLTNKNFPNADSILDGINYHAQNLGIEVVHDPLDQLNSNPDLGIVFLHENPYAEYYGDVKTLELPNVNALALTAIQKFSDKDIPVITILISGRPLWIETPLNYSSAFLAAWLPGTEGGGVADILFGKAPNESALTTLGKLPFAWPKDGDNRSVNPHKPLFDLSYGLNFKN